MESDPRTLVCLHGKLRRRCEACELADRLEGVEAERGRLVARVAELEAERDALVALVVKAGRALKPPQNGDWACAECKPHSAMLKAGFQCAYHGVQAFLFRPDVAKLRGSDGAC